MVKTKEDQDKEFQVVNRKRKRDELEDGDESSSDSDSDSDSDYEEPPRKRLKKELGKLPSMKEIRLGLDTVYAKLGPRLKECHYQSALQAYLEKIHNVQVFKEYPLKFKVFGTHIGYKRRHFTNYKDFKDDGKFYNYIDLYVRGSNGNIIIECKRDETYKQNIKFPFFTKKMSGKFKPSEPTFDQIQRYHELLTENKIPYKAFYLINFPSKKRSRIENHFVMKVPSLK